MLIDPPVIEDVQAEYNHRIRTGSERALIRRGLRTMSQLLQRLLEVFVFIV